MAWNIAISPGKSIFMNMFMMWMMGNAINIWTIFMVFMLFNAPIAALLSIENTFSRLQKGEAYLKQKFVFVLVNLLLLTLAVYKCTSLGLIPNASADWLEFVQPPQFPRATHKQQQKQSHYMLVEHLRHGATTSRCLQQHRLGQEVKSWATAAVWLEQQLCTRFNLTG